MLRPSEKRFKLEAIIGTIVIHSLLIILFYVLGLEHIIPIPEQGIMINFGAEEVEQNELKVIEKVKTPESIEKNLTEEEEEEVVAEEKIITQTKTETIKIKDNKKKKNEETRNKKSNKKNVSEKTEEKTQIDDKLKKALNRFKNIKDEKIKESKKNNYKGSSSAVDRVGASSQGKNGGLRNQYKLGNRNAITKPQPLYNCQEEGKVVIEVRVNQDGKTIDAKVTKGTENYSKCLIESSIKAALKTKWEPKNDGSSVQFGTITYRFILN